MKSPNASQELTDLTATDAAAAMRNGDIGAEDYARALLNRARRFESLNAFRTLDPGRRSERPCLALRENH